MNLKKIYSKKRDLNDSSNYYCFYNDFEINRQRKNLREYNNMQLNETVDKMSHSQNNFHYKSWIEKIKTNFSFIFLGDESETVLEVRIPFMLKLKHKIVRKKQDCYSKDFNIYPQRKDK